MRERLEDLILSQDAVTIASWEGKTFGTKAHRITPPDAFGVCQYTADRIDVAIDGKRSEVILDFLVEGEIARVSVNGLYKTSIHVSASLIEQDIFAVVYTTEHSSHLPLTLVAVGENIITPVSDRKEEESCLPPQKREPPNVRYAPNIRYAPLVHDLDNLVSLLSSVAIIDKEKLMERGCTEAEARYILHQYFSKHLDLLRYNAVRSGKVRTSVLVPRDGQESIFGKRKLDEAAFTTVRFVAKKDLERYVTIHNLSIPKKAIIPELTIEEKVYVPAAVLDAFAGSRSERGYPKPDAVILAPVSYTFEEHGLLTIVKDVALLDRVTLKERTGISSGIYAGAVLRRETERNGFAAYLGHSSIGSLKRFTLVPKGAEERIYNGLKLDKYEDIALVAREQVAAYFEEKGSSAPDISKASIVHLQAKEYYLAAALDDILATTALQSDSKSKGEREEVSEEELPIRYSITPVSDSLFQQLTAIVLSQNLLEVVMDTASSDAAATIKALQKQGFASYTLPALANRAADTVVLLPEEQFRKQFPDSLIRPVSLDVILESTLSEYLENKKKQDVSLPPSLQMRINDATWYRVIVVEEYLASLPSEKTDIETTKKKGNIDIKTYVAKGTVVDGVYSFEGRSVALFAGKDTALVKYGEVFNRFTSEELRFRERASYQQAIRKNLFSTTAPQQKRDDAGKLVPAAEKGKGKRHSLYVRDANHCLMYLVDNGYTGVSSSQKRHGESIDAVVETAATIVREESGERPSKKIPVGASASRDVSSATPLHYTLLEEGLVTIVKDVSRLDKKVFSLKISAHETYGSVLLGRKIREYDFATYYHHGTRGSRRRTVLVPRGSENIIYNGLTLDNYEDVALVAKERVSEYAAAKGIGEFISQFLTVLHMKGKEYYFATELDALIPINEDKLLYHLERRTTDNIDPILREAGIEIILLETYQPVGTRNGIEYAVGKIKRKLFADDARARVTKIYEKAGLISSHLQAEGLELLAQTDYETYYRHPNGEQLSVNKARARIDAGEEVQLSVAIANAAIMYLADHWHEIPAEEIASRRAWNFEDVALEVTNGGGRSGAKQRYRVPVVASPNGEYIVGRAAILQELEVHASNLHAAIPNLLELRVLGAREGPIESGQNWLIHRRDVNAIKHAIEYGKLPKNYIGHFAQ